MDSSWIDELNNRPYTPARSSQSRGQSKPSTKKQKDFWLDQISTGGGVGGALGGAAAGAAIGSVVPVIGTAIGGLGGAIIGGALGSGGGEIAENYITGEQNKLKNVGTEALIGGTTALPFGAGLKVAGAGVKAATGFGKTGARELLEQAGQKTLGKATAGTGAGVAGRVGDLGRQGSQEGFGLGVGQSIGGGKVLTPQIADNVQAFITQGAQRYGGIRAGKPIQQARDAQKVLNNVTNALDSTLDTIDRPLVSSEPANIIASALLKVGENPAVTGTTKTIDKFKTKIENARTLKDLERIRREADNLAFTSTGASKTSAAAQSHAVRDAIDEFITPLSADYKAIKGDYTLARDALNYTSKANKNAKGFTLPVVGVEVGKQAIPGAMNKVNSRLAGVGAETGAQPSIGALPRAVGTGVRGATARAFTGSGQTDPTLEDALLQQGQDQYGAESPMGQEAPQNPYPLENLMYDIQRDPKNADVYKYYYEENQKQYATADKKPLNQFQQERADLIGALDLTQQAVDQGSINYGPIGSRVEGIKSIFNAADPETLAFKNTVSGLQAAITKARAGASLTEGELRLLKKYTPSDTDSEQVVRSKLQQLYALYGNQAPTQGGTSLEDVLMNAQPAYR